MRTVSVPVFKDNLVDGPKTFRFNLSKNPSSVAEVVEGQSSALVTITDVDLAGVVKFVPDKYTVSEGVTSRQVTLTVRRTGGIGGGVTVDYATVDGTAVGGTEGEGDFDTHQRHADLRLRRHLRHLLHPHQPGHAGRGQRDLHRQC